MRLKHFVVLIFLLCFQMANCKSLFGELNLELVQVLFRHGERTPQSDEIKLMNNTSTDLEEPWGYSQLTNNGMNQEYRIGEMLRDRYGDFLGESYRPEYVYATSSDYDRTKASLELVLASLYPPSDELTWNEELNWIPIPIHFVPKELDVLFNLESCSKHRKLYKELMNSKGMKNQLSQFKDLFAYLRKFFPSVTFDLQELFFLNNVVNIKKSLEIEPSDWQTEEVEEYIRKGAKFYLDTLSYTPSLTRLNGGSLARRFIENMHREKSQRRIYLYSGHEFTLYAFAKAHGITLERSPAYGSAIIVEKLRDDLGQQYVKMYTWTGPSEELIPLKLENCDSFCPMDKYLSILEPYLPSDDEMLCLYKNVKPQDLQRILFTDTQAIST